MRYVNCVRQKSAWVTFGWFDSADDTIGACDPNSDFNMLR